MTARILTALIAALVAGGCASSARPLKHKPIERLQLADVPVPQMFDFQKQDSYIYDRTFRSCEMVYSGPGWLRTQKILDFYAQAMPCAAWQFIRREGADTRTLVFRKGDEECLVFARPSRDAESVELVIQLRPRA